MGFRSNNPVMSLSKQTMKKFSVFPLIAALAFFVSCQKQQTEEERKAEVERQVQDRLAAERLDTEKQRLAQEQADVEAREKAVSDKEAAANTVVAEPTAITATAPGVRERTETRTEKRSTASYGMFYQKLDPYGEWRETNDYGYVWQPREAEQSRDWRPYTEGRWVYSDAGWTWVSDEPFGWATYHYGRWMRLKRVGWVWVPGDEWAPAWVSWRTNKDYVGWAPLPPEARFDRSSGIQNWADSYYDIGPEQYSFVSSNKFGDEHVRRSLVPTDRNISIVMDTNNVTRITFANTTIMNEGPSYDELRSRSQRPIERYRLRRQNTEAAAIVRGDELEISVPIITEIRDMPRPRRIKERVIEMNIDNGWTIADRSAAERARTKIRTESTPPSNAPPKTFVKPEESTTAPATPAATAAATPTVSTPAAASATPAATITTKPSPSPTAAPAPSATAAAAASATPAAAASATPRTRPRFSPSPTPAATASTVASPTPAVSATVRLRPSPSIRPRPSPSVAPSVSPATTAAPEAVATAPAATTTPVPAVSPVIRNRPSPLPVITPEVRRKVPPPTFKTPEPTATASTATKPVPTLTPVRRATPPPRTVLPTPTVAPQQTDAAAPTVPPTGPKRVMPPRMTPPPAVTTPPPVATPSVAPSSPAATNDRLKNRRPKPPGPAETETATPTPAPVPPPN
ncbi:MAG: hypothetical protein QOF80_1665 [Verrucomicrobiota bacterium]